MASDGPQPPLPTRRSDAAPVVTSGAGDEEEKMWAEAPVVGDSVLVGGTPWGMLLSPTPLSVSAPPFPEKHCVQCGATETQQWRVQPVGLGALCNACRIRFRPAEALREPVHVHRHLPRPVTPAAFISRLVAEKSPFPAPVTVPDVEKKQKRKGKAWHPRTFKSVSTTPQKQEHRPAARPSFKPSAAEHTCIKLRGKELHQPPQPAAMQLRTGGELPTAGEPISLNQVQVLPDAIDGAPETPHILYGVGDELQMADPSSLDDEFLFNGPSAPMLIDDGGESLAD